MCATRGDLKKEVQKGPFREDLYYRLNVVPIPLPPLRERKEDILLLAEHFLNIYSRQMNRPVKNLSLDARELLLKYDFPGNTRELENILERATALAASEQIQPDDLQLAPPPSLAESPTPNARWPLQDHLDRVEREVIMEALDKTRYNRTAAAKLLGITFRALRYRMERLEIQ